MATIKRIHVEALPSNRWEDGRPDTDWQVVKCKDTPQDFNLGAGGKFVFIYYLTSGPGTSISGLRFLEGNGTPTPRGWTKIEVNLKAGTGSKTPDLYLCYATTTGDAAISLLKAGYGDNPANAWNDFDADDVVLRRDVNQGAGGKYVYLGLTWA